MTTRRCSICKDRRKSEFVARLHVENVGRTDMERLSRLADSGVPVMKRETIGAHLDVCLSTAEMFTPRKPQALNAVEQMGLQDEIHVPKNASRDDVANLVHDAVVKKLKAGEARVTVQHGLQAQSLLDKRDERKKDRQLAITLARLLGTPVAPEHVVQPRIESGEVIEGEVVTVTAEVN